MLRYILNRILNSLLVLAGVVFVILSIIELAPGTPGRVMLGAKASEVQVAALNAKLGFDRPFLLRFLEYLKNLFTRLDLGTSYKLSKPVSAIIGERIVPTLIIAFFAVVLVTILSITLGSIAARNRNRLGDVFISSAAGILSAIPGFFLAIVLLLVFAGKLHLLPVYGVKSWKGYILPVVTVAVTTMGSMIKLVRSVLLDVISQDYIRTARACGEKEKRLMSRHAMKNALLPVVTNIGHLFAGLLSGTVVVENIFSINGIGKFIVESISSRDIPAVCGTAVVIAGIFCFIQLLIDMSYILIDPRVKAKYGL